MGRILTFGEIMMRLQPVGYKRFFQADLYESCFGGGEANVAVSLTGFGEDAAFLTKLPENALGDACIAELKKRGVDTRFIIRGGGRLGLYFSEKGASQRPGRIIYDRKNSSINEISSNEIDFNALFSGVEWFHFSGITAALSQNVLDTLLALLKEAKKRRVTVSCDLNYRKKLWSKQKAGEVMSELIGYSDVLISNEEECKEVFGLEAQGSDIDAGVIDAAGYSALAEVLTDKFRNLKATAFTLRGSVSASVNRWAGVLTTAEGGFRSKEYLVGIVDRVGAGDSFTAGLIYSLINKMHPQYAVDFAAAASCLKHTVEGDFNIASKGEVESLMNGDASGRVQR
ncbi:MAG: sugar kinase [Clostridiales bacterium]|jgi:2-dehydro-3-deoxygluconokinase|nr:sugar kinase [Clostridiales bacterium]